MITVGDKRIGIRTSVLEEKATACNMLCCYADELKEGFFPWIDQVDDDPHFFVVVCHAFNEFYKFILTVISSCRLLPYWFLFSNFISMKKLERQLFQVLARLVLIFKTFYIFVSTSSGALLEFTVLTIYYL